MIGMGEAKNFSMMPRVESTRPPGVLISISSACALVAFASSRARPRNSSVTGLMVSFSTTLRTSAEPCGTATRKNVATMHARRRKEEISSVGQWLRFLRELGCDGALQSEGRRRWQDPDAEPVHRSGRLPPFYCLADRGGREPAEHRRRLEAKSRLRLGAGSVRRLSTS